MRIRILSTATIVACLQAGPLLAQGTPGSDTTPAPAPAASPAPAAPPAPAPSPAAAAPSTSPATASGETAKHKSPKRIRISAQTRHEIAHSLKTGTVPSRYRSQIPKEYQRYIPFEK